MKKLLAIGLIAAMALTVTACGGGNQVQKDPYITDVASTVYEKYEDFEAKTDIKLALPEGAELDACAIIESEPVVYEIDFELNGVKYGFRYAQGDEIDDISGLDIVWDKTEAIDDAVIEASNDGKGIYYFNDLGYNWCLMTMNGGENVIDALASTMSSITRSL